MASHNPFFQLLCDSKNLKICLPDNHSLLDSSHFKSDGIWVLEKGERLTWTPTQMSWQKPLCSHYDFHADCFLGTLSGSPTVSCSIVFPLGPSPPTGPPGLLPVQSRAAFEPWVCASAQQSRYSPHLPGPAHLRLLCSVFLRHQLKDSGEGQVANPTTKYLSFFPDGCQGWEDPCAPFQHVRIQQLAANCHCTNSETICWLWNLGM